MEQTYPLQPVVAFFLKIGTYKKHRLAMGAVLFCTYEIQTTTKSLKKACAQTDSMAKLSDP